MSQTAPVGKENPGFVALGVLGGRYRAQLWLGIRILAAGLLTFAIAHLLGFAQSYWAVLTAVIVMQASVGGSIKATSDRLFGSLGGAVWGVVVCLTIPHTSVPTLGLALAAALAPLTILVAFKPSLRVAPVTAVILLLTPTSQAAGPVAAALQRMIEVGLGSLVAVVVAFALAPTRAIGALKGGLLDALDGLSALVTILIGSDAEARDDQTVDRIHADLRRALAAAEAASDEARRERALGIQNAPDPTPLCRTLRRLRHDLVMVGRASGPALPPEVRLALEPAAMAVANAVKADLAAIANGLRGPKIEPSDASPQALTRFAEVVAGMRSSGMARELPDEAVGHLFGLAFALGQLGQDLADLKARARELSDPAVQSA